MNRRTATRRQPLLQRALVILALAIFVLSARSVAADWSGWTPAGIAGVSYREQYVDPCGGSPSRTKTYLHQFQNEGVVRRTFTATFAFVDEEGHYTTYAERESLDGGALEDGVGDKPLCAVPGSVRVTTRENE